MRTGAAMGLRPVEFWALTPAELMLMTGRTATSSPMDRARLGEMAALYPDSLKETRDGGDG
jgi:uncharacterized phage protein (TIGR02216 family)